LWRNELTKKMLPPLYQRFARAGLGTIREITFFICALTFLISITARIRFFNTMSYQSKAGWTRLRRGRSGGGPARIGDQPPYDKEREGLSSILGRSRRHPAAHSPS